MTRTIATLLAATVFAAGALVTAGAASAEPTARIAYGDLDMSTTAGARTFAARVESTARDFCRDARNPGSRISDSARCQIAIREEAMAQLARQSQAQAPAPALYAANRL